MRERERERERESKLLYKLKHTDYADDLLILTHTTARAESRLHNQEQAAGSISLHVNVEFMCFKQKGAISTLCGSYLGSNISSIESDVNIRRVEAWTAIDRISIIWKFDLSPLKNRNLSKL